MTTKIIHNNLWPTITKLTKESKNTHVAVGYLGHGVQSMLPLHKGSSLVVDMSLESVQAGQTCPLEIEEYIKRGVEAYTYKNLHAKVYVFDNIAIICSANVSKRSKNTLLEIGALRKDRGTVNEARKLVKELQTKPITKKYLELCKKLYRPSRRSEMETLPYRWYIEDVKTLNESRETFDAEHHISKYAQSAAYSRDENGQIDGVVVLWWKSSIEQFYPSESRNFLSTGKRLKQLKLGVPVYLVENKWDRGVGVKKVENPKARARGKLVALTKVEDDSQTVIFPTYC